MARYVLDSLCQMSLVIRVPLTLTQFIDMFVWGRLMQEYSISEHDFDDLGLLGSGSSGNVAKMRHKPTNRVIAIKVG